MAGRNTDRKMENVVSFERSAGFFFDRGMKYVQKKQYERSLKYLRKAAELEPYRTEYQFNLAGVLAEIKRPKESNNILFHILKEVDPTMTECYFGIACNYFDQGEYRKAMDFFERYIYLSPEGEFAEEAQEVLYYLQIQEDVLTGSRNGKKIIRLIEDGQKYLDQGKYEKAIEKFETALEADMESVWIRDQLSLAYAGNGQYEQALAYARSALRLDPYDFLANCYIFLFSIKINGEPTKAQIGALNKLKPANPSQYMQLIEAYGILERHEEIRLLIDQKSDEIDGPVALHYLAVACYNLGNLDEAVLSWEKLRSAYPQYKLLADICISYCNAENSARPEKLPYSMGIMPSGGKKAGCRWEKEWDDIINCAMSKREKTYKGAYKKELKQLWLHIINNYPGTGIIIRKKEVWAAVLEYLYCSIHMIHVSRSRLAEKYNVSLSAIGSKLKSLDLSKENL